MRVCSVLPCFVRMRLGKQYIPLRKRSCKVLGTKHLLWLPFHHLKTSPFRIYSNFPKLKLADMTRTFIVVFKIVLAEGGSSLARVRRLIRCNGLYNHTGKKRVYNSLPSVLYFFVCWATSIQIRFNLFNQENLQDLICHLQSIFGIS